MTEGKQKKSGGKGKKRVLVFTELDATDESVLYRHVHDMPWQRIEQTAGKVFTAVERAEIFECAQAYSHQEQFHDGGVSIASIEALRQRILNHASELAKIAEEHIGLSDVGIFKTSHLAQDKEQIFDGLVELYGASEIWVREELDHAAKHSRRLVDALMLDTKSAPVATEQSESLALAAFVNAILSGAVAQPARGGHHGYAKNQASEYSRWGIAIGPRVTGFPEFATAVLGRDVSVSQAEYAFKNPARLVGNKSLET